MKMTITWKHAESFMNHDITGLRRAARRLRLSEKPVPLDLFQEGGRRSYWAVQATQEIVPVAAFNSERSAIAYVEGCNT